MNKPQKGFRFARSARIAAVVFGFALAAGTLFAWSPPPSGTPPTCPAGSPGCDAPINVGNTLQSKDGNLMVNAGGSFATGFSVPFGNVGIGTTGPGEKLAVSKAVGDGTNLFSLQRVSDRKFTFNVNGGLDIRDDAGTPFLFIQNVSGNVGIGKTNPGQKLDVVGNINVPAGSCFMINGTCLVSSSGGDITAVNAGTGLSGGGASGDVTLSADTGYLQRRVSGACGAGSSVRVVNQDGTVICETDDVGLTSESDTFDTVTARGSTSNRSIFINSGYVYAYNNAYPIRLGELWGHTGLYNGSASHIMYFGSDQYFQFLNRAGSYGPGVYAQDYYSNAAGVWMSQLCRSNGTNCPATAGVYLPLSGGTMNAGSTITFNNDSRYGVGVGVASPNKGSIAVDTVESDGGTLELNYYGGGEVHVGSGGSKALRAAIIYDGNNGAYYVDPASTSVLNSVNFNILNPSTGNSPNGGYSHYGIYEQPGTWTYPYPDLMIEYHTGISYVAYQGYGGHRFYTGYSPDASPTTLSFSVGEGDTNTRVYSDLYVGAASGGGRGWASNTFCRWDGTNCPAQSGGTITGVTAGTGLSGGGTSGNVTLTNTGVTSIIAGSGISINQATGAVTVSAPVVAETDTLQSVTNRGGSTSQSITAPIFYDWNDSAYYIDMNNTSRLNYLGRNYGWNWTEYDWNNPAYYMDLDQTSRLNALYANTFIYNSDESLKKDVKTIPNALEKILKLRGVEFNWKKDERPSVGLIAQEVEQVFPELVHAEPQSGLKAVEYGNLVAPLIEAVKELKAENDSLRARVEKLEAEN